VDVTRFSLLSVYYSSWYRIFIKRNLTFIFSFKYISIFRFKIPYLYPLLILIVAFLVLCTDIHLQQRREEAEKNRSLDVLRAAVVCVLGHVDTGENQRVSSSLCSVYSI
jgi:hypothetical protein